jgi:heat shock protein HslJ
MACALIPTPAPTATPSPMPTATTKPNPTATPIPPVNLDGTAWVLTELMGRTPLSGTTITLSFDGGKAAGTDGCNRYNTSYTSSGSKLTFDKNIISTKMACPANIMQQGSAFTKALAEAAGFKSDGKRLTLVNAGGQALAEFNVQGQSLGGTSWVATSINNGKNAVVSVIQGTKVTAEFGTDGSVGGTAGCNRYGGKYQVSGKGLKISGAVSTMMACLSPAGVMEQEKAYLKALESAAVYRIDGDELEIRDAGGAVLVSFDKVR